MRKYAGLVIFCLSLAVSLCAKGVRYGMNRAEVEASLGKPAAVLTHGSRLVLLYPKNGRVELEQGVVVTLSNVPVDTENSATSPTPAAPASVDIAADSSNAADQKAQAAAEAAAERQRQEIQRRLEEATEKLAESHGKVQFDVAPKPARFWTGLIVGFVLRTLFTAVVLKFAFKWSDVHAEWGQMFIPALADTLAQSGISAAAFALWKTDQLFYIDSAISYFVLLGVLMKTTHACTLQRAVAVAGAAKLGSLILWAGVSVVLMHLLA
jgi:hypothetical protein